MFAAAELARVNTEISASNTLAIIEAARRETATAFKLSECNRLLALELAAAEKAEALLLSEANLACALKVARKSAAAGYFPLSFSPHVWCI